MKIDIACFPQIVKHKGSILKIIENLFHRSDGVPGKMIEISLDAPFIYLGKIDLEVVPFGHWVIVLAQSIQGASICHFVSGSAVPST